MRLCRKLVFLLSSVSAIAAQPANPDGLQIYSKHCAVCHDSGATRIPQRTELRKLDASHITEALTSGVMKQQGATLSQAERDAVANWIGQNEKGEEFDAPGNHCSAAQSTEPNYSSPSWTSWGASLTNWRFQTPHNAGLRPDQFRRLKLKWAFAVPGAISVRSQPVFVAGRLFFGTGTKLFSLDGASGCIHWVSRLRADIRSGITFGSPGNKPTLFFGDDAGQVNAVDAITGQPLWQFQGDAHPTAKITGAPAYDRDRLYVPVASDEEAVTAQPGYVCCTFRGSIVALDARNGQALWRTYTIDENASARAMAKSGGRASGPSGAGVWSSPTLDVEHGVLYATTGDNYSQPATQQSDAILALSMDTGKILWTKQLRVGDIWNVSCLVPPFFNCPDPSGPDFDFGAPAVLAKTKNGHRLLLLGQKSGAVYALDADKKGDIVWQAQTGKGGNVGGVEWGIAFDGKRVFAPVSDLVLRASDPSAPMVSDPKAGGGLFAFDAETGQRLWRAEPASCGARQPCSPAQTAPVTAIQGAVLSGSMDGHIRAYSARTGKVIWDYDTVQKYRTVNGVPGQGGSLSVAGPVIANGTLFLNSGYAGFGGTPGNTVLAFSAASP